MLVLAPVVRLPFILHLADCFAGIVAFLSGRILTRILSLAGKESLATTLVCNTSLGHKMAPSRRVLEGNAGETKHNFIITKEHWHSPSNTIILYIGQLMARGIQDRTGLVTSNNRCPFATVLILLGEVEKVRHGPMRDLPPVQSAICQRVPWSIYELRPQHVV